jgi:hypothetical protein
MTTTNAPTSTTTAFTPSVWHPVPRLDEAAQWTAGHLGKATRVSAAGAFWHTAGAVFTDAWVDRQADGSGCLTVRLGRLELIIDWRAPRST